MKTIYCIIVMCLSLCFVISCGGDDTNDGGDTNAEDFEIGPGALNGILAEVTSIYNDYFIAIVTGGDDNFSQDDQINIYFDVYSPMPCIEAIQVGDTIDVEYLDNAFSKTDGVFSINAYAIARVGGQ